MTARVVDTSLLAALFSATDAHHQEAAAAFGARDLLLLPTEILVEFAGLWRHRHGATITRAAIEYVVKLPHVALEGRSDPAAAMAIFLSDSALSLPDAFVVQHCVAHRCDVAGFDGRLREAVGRARAA